MQFFRRRIPGSEPIPQEPVASMMGQGPNSPPLVFSDNLTIFPESPRATYKNTAWPNPVSVVPSGGTLPGEQINVLTQVYT
jgi:hypothetical protein